MITIQLDYAYCGPSRADFPTRAPSPHTHPPNMWHLPSPSCTSWMIFYVHVSLPSYPIQLISKSCWLSVTKTHSIYSLLISPLLFFVQITILIYFIILQFTWYVEYISVAILITIVYSMIYRMLYIFISPAKIMVLNLSYIIFFFKSS